VRGSIHVGFVVDIVAPAHVSLQVRQFSHNYHSTMAFHAHVICGMNNRPVVATVQRHKSHPIDMNSVRFLAAAIIFHVLWIPPSLLSLGIMDFSLVVTQPKCETDLLLPFDNK
jgi:hypothetical protein